MGLAAFWIVALALTLAVGALLALAVLRPRGAPQGAASDVLLYRDQLAEVDRDLARGVLVPEEAERVRLEVSRRLLAADAAAQAEAPQGGQGLAPRLVGPALAVLLLLGSVALYVWVGAPGMPDRPLQDRLAESDAALRDRPSQAAFEAARPMPFVPPAGADPALLELMPKLREAAGGNPDDLEGQILLARNEMALGNFRAAHQAVANIIRLKGPRADEADHTTYLDLLVLAADGYVSPEAEAAAMAALEFDQRNGTARYYLGLMYAQSARPDRALTLWAQLLRESSARAPWVPPILAQIEEVAAAAGVRYRIPERFLAPAPGPGPALPGPSAEDMEAAQEMEAEDRQAMIRGMVEGLAERLGTEGGSAEEWARLINALGVLGERDRAAAIWAEAQGTFAQDAPGLATIRTAAERAGLTE